MTEFHGEAQPVDPYGDGPLNVPGLTWEKNEISIAPPGPGYALAIISQGDNDDFIIRTTKADIAKKAVKDGADLLDFSVWYDNGGDERVLVIYGRTESWVKGDR